MSPTTAAFLHRESFLASQHILKRRRRLLHSREPLSVGLLYSPFSLTTESRLAAKLHFDVLYVYRSSSLSVYPSPDNNNNNERDISSCISKITKKGKRTASSSTEPPKKDIPYHHKFSTYKKCRHRFDSVLYIQLPSKVIKDTLGPAKSYL